MVELHVVSTYSFPTCSYGTLHPLCHLTPTLQCVWLFPSPYLCFTSFCSHLKIPFHPKRSKSFPLILCFYCHTQPVLNEVSGAQTAFTPFVMTRMHQPCAALLSFRMCSCVWTRRKNMTKCEINLNFSMYCICLETH